MFLISRKKSGSALTRDPLGASIGVIDVNASLVPDVDSIGGLKRSEINALLLNLLSLENGDQFSGVAA